MVIAREFWAISTSVMLAGTAAGQSPWKLAIKAPSEAAIGELVVLEAECSEQKAAFAWTMIPPKGFLAVENGRKVVFSSGTTGISVFVLAAAVEGRVAIAQHSLRIGPPAPPGPAPPPPEPNPPSPNPSPNDPLADWICQQAMKTPLDAEQRRQTAQALAGSFESIAAAIRAGTLAEPRTILAETLAANQRAIAPFADAWEKWKPFKQAVIERLKRLHGEGKLTTPTDFAATWTEIARGLRAVR